MVRSKKFFSVVEWVVLILMLLILGGFWLFHYSPWSAAADNFVTKFQTTLAKQGLAPLPQNTSSVPPVPPVPPVVTNYLQTQAAASAGKPVPPVPPAVLQYLQSHGGN